MVKWRNWIAGGLLWPAFALAKAPDALLWLERMEQAQRQQSYQGTFIHEQRNGLLQSVHVLHLADEQGVRDQLQYLDGPERVLVRSGKHLYFQVADPKAWTQNLASELGPVRQKLSQSEQLQTYYRVELVRDDRVAGRATVVVDLVPQDRHRYGMRLWLDQASGVLLKNLVIDPENGVLERMQFTQFSTQLNAGDVIPTENQTKLSNKANDISLMPEAELPWQASWVPGGFELLRQGVQPSQVTDQPVSALIYSDGLANFSIFVEANHDPVLNDARQRQGATSALSKVMYHQEQYYLVTVVGEIPMGVAERVAVSVQASALPQSKPES